MAISPGSAASGAPSPSSDYTLVAYRKLYPDSPGRPPSTRWYIYYRVPGENMQRAIYVDAEDLLEDQVHQVIREDLARRASSAP